MIAAIGRRTALAAIVACALAPLAHAQDPRAAVAQDAARKWLAIVDRFDVAASYEAAGEMFREVLKPDGWTQAVKTVREPLGAVTGRTAVHTEFASRIPGLPPGEYALIHFRTSFAKQEAALERVTLGVEAYRWRVVGYTIQQ